MPVVALRSRAFAEYLKPHLAPCELDRLTSSFVRACVEEAGGCARMGLRGVFLALAVLLSVFVGASHGLTDSQDSEYIHSLALR